MVSVDMCIVCDACKVQLWVGQGSIFGETLYSGQPETMEQLRQFLFAHEEHPLRFVQDHRVEYYVDLDPEREALRQECLQDELGAEERASS